MPVCNQCGKSRILHTGKYLSCEQMAEQGCGGWKKTRRLRLPEGAQSTREGRATSSAEGHFFSIGCVGVLGSTGQAEAYMPCRSGFRDASFAGARGSIPSSFPAMRQRGK